MRFLAVPEEDTDTTCPRSTNTRMSDSKKADVLALRHQVVELETHLKRLQQKRARAHTRAASSLDQEAATIQAKLQKAIEIECRDRQRSEEVNRKLKALLARQKKLQKALREKLPRKSFTLGSDFDEKTQASGANNAAIVAQLEDTVTKLYKDSSSVLPAYPPTTHSSMKTRRDEARGEIVEIFSTTPLACQASSAADFAWKNLTAHSPCAVGSARPASQPQGDSHAKSWTCHLKSEPDVKLLECTQFLRKFDEPTQVVIASASVMETPKGGTRFCSQSTAIITCSASNPNASVVRVCGQVFVDGGVSSSSELKSLGLKMWQESQLFQDELIDEAEATYHKS